MMKSTVLLLSVLAILFSGPQARADFADAVAAYDGGDYATAFSGFLEAAEQGDADGQYMAGFLYMRGQGTGLDLPRAYQWFTLAARQGDTFAAHELEGLTARMSAKQVSQAEALLRAD